MDEENLAFLFIDPLLCKPDYEFLISSEDRKALELSDSCEGVQTLVIVNVNSAGPLEITANFPRPVVMNVKKSIAGQIVLYQSSCSSRFPNPAFKKRFAIYECGNKRNGKFQVPNSNQISISNYRNDKDGKCFEYGNRELNFIRNLLLKIWCFFFSE